MAKKGWLEPFSKETGVKYVMDAPTEMAKIKAMVEAGQTSWDVVSSDASTGAAACGTLFKKLPKSVDLSGIDPKYVTDPCSVPFETQTIALVYNKKLYGNNPPTSITDFMDTKKFPGKRVMAGYSIGGLESLLLASGVEGKNLYPLDLNRAASTIKTLGKNLVLHDSLAQEQDIEKSGDFGVCLCYLGRSEAAAEQGADIGVVWNGIFSVWQGAYALKGSKSPAAQTALLQFIANPKKQAGMYKYVAYGSTAKDPVTEAPAKFDPYLASKNQSKIKDEGLFNTPWWKANSDKANAAWTAMTTG
jgi:putative spermidine/putrescine transport system substrate-binding protein